MTHIPSQIPALMSASVDFDEHNIAAYMQHLLEVLAKHWQADSLITLSLHTIRTDAQPDVNVDGDTNYVALNLERFINDDLTSQPIIITKPEKLGDLARKDGWQGCIAFRLAANREQVRPYIDVLMGYREAITVDDAKIISMVVDNLCHIYRLTWQAYRNYRVNLLGQRLDDYKDIGELFSGLCEQIADILDISHCIMLAEYWYLSGNMRIHYVRDGVDGYRDGILNDSVINWVTRNQLPLIIGDLDTYDSTPKPQPMPDVSSPNQPTKSLIYLPVVVRNETMGVLTVQHRTPNYYTKFDVALLKLICSQLSINLHNLQLTSSLDQMTAFDKLFGKTIEDEDEHALLRDMINAVTKTLQANHASLHLYDSLKGQFQRDVYDGGDTPRRHENVDSYREHYGIITQTRAMPQSILFVKDAQNDLYRLVTGHEDQRDYEPFEKREHNASTVVASLRGSDDVLGVLFVNFKSPQSFDTTHRRFIVAVINYVTAIVNTLQHNRMVRDSINQRFSALSIEVENLESVYDKSIQSVMEILEPTDAAIFILNKHAQHLHIVRAEGKHAHLRLWQTKTLSVAPDNDTARGLVRLAFMRNMPILVDDITTNEEYRDIYFPMNPDTRAEFDIPLRVGDEKLGVLSLESEKPFFFSNADKRFLDLLAQRVSVAISNADKFQQIQSLNASMSQMITLLEDLNSVTDHRSKKWVYERILDTAIILTKADSGNLMLLADDSHDELVIEAYEGKFLPNINVEKFRQNIDDGIIGQAISNGEAVIVGDVRQVNNYLPVMAGMVSELAVPLYTPERGYFGAINLESETPHYFTHEVHQHVVNLFAGIVPTVLKNIEEYNERLDRERRLDNYRHHVDGLSEILDRILNKEVDQLANRPHITSGNRQSLADSAKVEESDEDASLQVTIFRDLIKFALEVTNSEFGNLHIYRNNQVIYVYDARRTATGMDYYIPRLSDEIKPVSIQSYGLVKRAVKERRLISTGDTRTLKLFDEYTPSGRAQQRSLVPDDVEILSEIAVPLIDEDEIIGILNVEDCHLNHYSELDISMIDFIAKILTVALRNASVVERLALIVETEYELSACVDPEHVDEAYKIVVEKLNQTRTQCQIYVRRFVDGNLITQMKHLAKGENVIPSLEKPIKEQPHWDVFTERKTIYLPNREDDPRYPNLPSSPSLVRSQIIAPLTPSDAKDSEFYGTLTMAHPTTDRFNEEDELLVKAMARQLALTLQRIEHKKQQEESHIMAALGNYAASVMHDIKNRLNVSQKWNQAVIKLSEQLDAESVERFKRFAENVGDTLEDVYRQAADWEKRLRSLKSIVHIEPISLRDLLAEIKEMFANDEIPIIDDGVGDLTLLADQVELKFALENVIDNALKAVRSAGRGSAGFVKLYTEVETRWDGKAQLALYIEDNGNGISVTPHEQIFSLLLSDRDPQDSGGKQSWGYGLWASQQHIRRNKGTIRVHNTQLGIGTTFVIRLPLADFEA